jgi:hypothetical protein
MGRESCVFLSDPIHGLTTGRRRIDLYLIVPICFASIKPGRGRYMRDYCDNIIEGFAGRLVHVHASVPRSMISTKKLNIDFGQELAKGYFKGYF